MSIIVGHDTYLRCDHCGAESKGHPDQMKALSMAQGQGWYQSPNSGSTSCPGCSGHPDYPYHKLAQEWIRTAPEGELTDGQRVRRSTLLDCAYALMALENKVKGLVRR